MKTFATVLMVMVIAIAASTKTPAPHHAAANLCDESRLKITDAAVEYRYANNAELTGSVLNTCPGRVTYDLTWVVTNPDGSFSTYAILPSRVAIDPNQRKYFEAMEAISPGTPRHQVIATILN